MPPKRATRGKKKTIEADEAPQESLAVLRCPQLQFEEPFTSALQPIVNQMMIHYQEKVNLLMQQKDQLKQTCQKVGGKKAIPKTPKRGGAFATIKDTIAMFENFGVSATADEMADIKPDVATIANEQPVDVVAVPPSPARLRAGRSTPRTAVSPSPLRVSPTRTSPTHTTPKQNTAAVKMEVLSDIAHPMTLRSGTRQPTPVQPTTPRIVRTPVRGKNGTIPPQRQRVPIGTPSRAARVLLQQDNADSDSSKTKAEKEKKELAKQKEKEMKEKMMKKIEERGKVAILNKEEMVREKAERTKKEREERERKVQLRKEMAAKERERKVELMRERERNAAELRKRQQAAAQSPARDQQRVFRTNTPRQGAKTPVGKAKSAAKRLISSPYTPRVPPKRSAQMNDVDMKDEEEEENEDREEDEREEERKREEEKKRQEREMREEQKRKEEAEKRRKEKEAEIQRKEEEERKRKEREEQERREKEERIRREEEAERQRMEELKKKKRDDLQRELLEKIKIQREQEQQAKAAALSQGQTPLVNRNLLNASQISSYEMTPDKVFAPSTENDYGIDDISSNDETDDEENPRKTIPKWATNPTLKEALRAQRRNPPFDVETFFGAIEQPVLTNIFRPSTKYPKRTSSAQWDSPISNPTKGKSRFLGY